MLALLFAFEPDKLNRLVSEVANVGGGGLWKGVVRVPGALNKSALPTEQVLLVARHSEDNVGQDTRLMPRQRGDSVSAARACDRPGGPSASCNAEVAEWLILQTEGHAAAASTQRPPTWPTHQPPASESRTIAAPCPRHWRSPPHAPAGDTATSVDTGRSSLPFWSYPSARGWDDHGRPTPAGGFMAASTAASRCSTATGHESGSANATAPDAGCARSALGLSGGAGRAAPGQLSAHGALALMRQSRNTASFSAVSMPSPARGRSCKGMGATALYSTNSSGRGGEWSLSSAMDAIGGTARDPLATSTFATLAGSRPPGTLTGFGSPRSCAAPVASATSQARAFSRAFFSQGAASAGTLGPVPRSPRRSASCLAMIESSQEEIPLGPNAEAAAAASAVGQRAASMSHCSVASQASGSRAIAFALSLGTCPVLSSSASAGPVASPVNAATGSITAGSSFGRLGAVPSAAQAIFSAAPSFKGPRKAASPTPHIFRGASSIDLGGLRRTAGLHAPAHNPSGSPGSGAAREEHGPAAAARRRAEGPFVGLHSANSVLSGVPWSGALKARALQNASMAACARGGPAQSSGGGVAAAAAAAAPAVTAAAAEPSSPARGGAALAALLPARKAATDAGAPGLAAAETACPGATATAPPAQTEDPAMDNGMAPSAAAMAADPPLAMEEDGLDGACLLPLPPLSGGVPFPAASCARPARAGHPSSALQSATESQESRGPAPGKVPRLPNAILAAAFRDLTALPKAIMRWKVSSPAATPSALVAAPVLRHGNGSVTEGARSHAEGREQDAESDGGSVCALDEERGREAAEAEPECWHEVWATGAKDPVTGRDIIIVSQVDVTAKVIAERHVALVMETEHRLVEQIFPRHILQSVTEEWTAGESPGGSGCRSRAASGRGHSWRPVVHDYDGRLATSHPAVTLLFADIKGFTPACKELEPRQVMALLNALYSRYDAMLDKYGVYKVETIGDCYFVAGGLIREDEDGMAAVREGDSSEDPLHAQRVFKFAEAMLAAARQVRMPNTGQPVEIRIGIHTGPVVSGVVGTRMPRFCLFGDTVNTASRMESTGVPGAIHASEATFSLLPNKDEWEPTGGIQVKGKGLMSTYMWRPRTVPSESLFAGALSAGVSGGAGGGSVEALTLSMQLFHTPMEPLPDPLGCAVPGVANTAAAALGDSDGNLSFGGFQSVSSGGQELGATPAASRPRAPVSMLPLTREAAAAAAETRCSLPFEFRSKLV